MTTAPAGAGGRGRGWHFYSFAAANPTTSAFFQNYTGQAYYYFSKDNGKTWEFVPRTLPPDAGRTWADPLRVDESDDSDLWPWLAVGGPGKVDIAWLEASKKLPGNDPETPGDQGWRIVAAQSLNGLGCGKARRSGVPDRSRHARSHPYGNDL